MRILTLSTWFPYPPNNGSKTRAYHLLRSLATSHEVTLIAFQPDASDRNAKILASELDIPKIYPVHADPFRHTNLPRLLRYSSPIPLAFWPSRRLHQAVTKAARSSQWDVVVSFLAPVARYALQVHDTSRVLDMDTSLTYQMYERYGAEKNVLARLQAWVSWQKARQYETRLLRKFQTCTVVSKREEDYLGSMTRDTGCRVVLNSNGVDCQHNHLGVAQSRPRTLVFNGALSYSANYDAMQYFLTEIYPCVRKQIPDASLSITGSVADIDLGKLALDPSVRLTGYLDDIRPEVAGAGVCVVPLRQGSGTRIKILEAMALGTPVVATSKGAEGLEVTHNQDILIADEPDEFAAQVVRLLNNTTLHRRLVANARRLVEQRYDWFHIGQDFARLVESAADRNMAGRP